MHSTAPKFKLFMSVLLITTQSEKSPSLDANLIGILSIQHWTAAEASTTQGLTPSSSPLEGGTFLLSETWIRSASQTTSPSTRGSEALLRAVPPHTLCRDVPLLWALEWCCFTEAAPPVMRISDQSSRKFCCWSDTKSTFRLWKGFSRGCL